MIEQMNAEESGKCLLKNGNPYFRTGIILMES